jgi:hypothetical protein
MISDMTDLPNSDVEQRGWKPAKARAACLLSLAATPIFAIMALLTAVHGASTQDMICSAAPEGSRLTGMIPMYLLMSAFHLGPWLRLLTSR